MKNVSSDSGSGRGSESNERHSRIGFPQHMELLVVWSKVMAPLRHAVSLVNYKSRQKLSVVKRGEDVQSLLTAGQTLRSEIEKCWQVGVSS